MPKDREGGFWVPKDEVPGKEEGPDFSEGSSHIEQNDIGDHPSLDSFARLALAAESDQTTSIDEAAAIAKRLGCNTTLLDSEHAQYSFYKTPITKGSLWLTWDKEKGWSAELFGASKTVERTWSNSLEVAIRMLIQSQDGETI